MLKEFKPRRWHLYRQVVMTARCVVRVTGDGAVRYTTKNYLKTDDAWVGHGCVIIEAEMWKECSASDHVTIWLSPGAGVHAPT